MHRPGEFFLFFFAFILVWVVISTSFAQNDTPFCKICLCTSLANGPLSVNCISEEISNIYDPKFWFDEMNNSYPMKVFILHYHNLSTLNTTFPVSKLKELDLSRNGIEKLGVNIFYQLQEMTTLNLAHNKIENINPHTFRGSYDKSLYFPLRSLKRLDLEYNELHTLNADTFEHIDELEELNLSHNPFKVIDAPTLQALTSLVYLKTLSLAYTQLRTLPEYFLHTPKHLRSLDLSGNLLESIPSALKYSGIITLFLNRNPLSLLHAREPFPSTLTSLHMNHMPSLSAVEAAAFAECPDLLKLHLSNNLKLSVIDPDAFVVGDDHLQLVQVSLNNNNLSSISQGLISNWSRLKELDLYGNPWTCNCSVRWMFNTREDLTFLGQLRCAAPPEMQGLTFYDLVQNRTVLQCQEVKKTASRYITLLVILCSLLLALILFIVFYIRKKRRVSGPKFQVIAGAR